MSIIDKYRRGVQHEHGWELELTCPACGHTAPPHYEGWKPNKAINFGSTATVFALLSCAECGHGLREVAGRELVALFSDVTVPKVNRRLIAYFTVAVVLLVLLPIVAQYLFRPSFHIGSYGILLVLPLIFVFNYRVASLRMRCSCDTPKYLFMGLLGRSYCYRCSTCGRLLRLRD